MNSAFNLCGRFNHTDNKQDALKYFCDFISNAVASLGFVINFASKAVVAILIYDRSTPALVAVGGHGATKHYERHATASQLNIEFEH